MKILNSKPTVTKEFLVKKFEKIHIEKSNSTVNKYVRVGFNDQNSLSSDQSETNTNSDSCSLIFSTGALYNFINTILPEEKVITLFNVNSIEYYSQLSEELSFQYINLGYKIFIDKLLKREFLNQFPYEEEIYNSITSNDYSIYKTFYLQLEDSNGNKFGRTSTARLNYVSQESSSSIIVPINNAETTDKDGFNANDEIKVFLINTYYNISIELICVGNPNMLAATKKEIVITNIGASDSNLTKYNTLYASL